MGDAEKMTGKRKVGECSVKEAAAMAVKEWTREPETLEKLSKFFNGAMDRENNPQQQVDFLWKIAIFGFFGGYVNGSIDVSDIFIETLKSAGLADKFREELTKDAN